MMRLVTVHFPEAILEALDALVRLRIFPNRSEAIRYAVKTLIKEEGGLRYLLSELSPDDILVIPKVSS